jgi:hypothetical protein
MLIFFIASPVESWIEQPKLMETNLRNMPIVESKISFWKYRDDINCSITRKNKLLHPDYAVEGIVDSSNVISELNEMNNRDARIDR